MFVLGGRWLEAPTYLQMTTSNAATQKDIKNIQTDQHNHHEQGNPLCLLIR